MTAWLIYENNNQTSSDIKCFINSQTFSRSRLLQWEILNDNKYAQYIQARLIKIQNIIKSYLL